MIPLGGLVNAAGGLLFVALGLWVATLRPRNPMTAAFSAFCVAFGAVFTFQNLFDPDQSVGYHTALMVTSGLAAFPAGAAILLLAARTPRALGPDRRLLALPLGAGAVIAAVGVTPAWLEFPPTFRAILGDALAPAFLFLTVGVQTMFAAQWAAALLLARRFRALPPDAPERRQLPVMAVAIALFPAFFNAVLATAPDFGLRIMGGTGIAAAMLHAALWLRAVPEGGGRPAIGAALVPLALCVTGIGLSRALGSYGAVDALGAFGLARAVGVGVLAYAILRHQLLGLDVKVRWTIKQSTVAAAFIGVFFVVSEGAQQMFSESLGPMVGIAAAGMLVFAMAPLQRAAERVASAAIPEASGHAPAAPDRASDASGARLYEVAARKFLADGKLSRDEELQLAQIAERLGVGAGEATRVRHAVEDELAGGRRGRPRSP